MQAAVKARGWNFCRIDGSVVKAEARQAEVERFQTAPGGTRGIPVFLLTTQVGCLGHKSRSDIRCCEGCAFSHPRHCYPSVPAPLVTLPHDMLRPVTHMEG
jgi:hypothetical protein